MVAACMMMSFQFTGEQWLKIIEIVMVPLRYLG